jgi:hypothetical protein
MCIEMAVTFTLFRLNCDTTVAISRKPFPKVRCDVIVMKVWVAPAHVLLFPYQTEVRSANKAMIVWASTSANEPAVKYLSKMRGRTATL